MISDFTNRSEAAALSPERTGGSGAGRLMLRVSGLMASYTAAKTL